jgi:D-inositol-3-phosphate glycosyltransferase
VIRDGYTGVLVPSRDPAALADALQELLADPARAQQLGDAGRLLVQSEFDLHECAAPVADLLRLQLPTTPRAPVATPA